VFVVPMRAARASPQTVSKRTPKRRRGARDRSRSVSESEVWETFLGSTSRNSLKSAPWLTSVSCAPPVTHAYFVQSTARTARNAEPVDPVIGTTHMCQCIVECGLLTGTRSAEGIMASGSCEPHQRAEHMAAPPGGTNSRTAETVGSVTRSPSGSSSWGGSGLP